jgi:hypothetical protein
VTRIIRAALAAGPVAVLFACTLNPSAGSFAPPPRVSVSALPSATAGNSVWVLSPVGLNLRATPDPLGEKVTLLEWGQRLDVSETRRVGADSWLHAKLSDGTDGWVLDRPDLVIHRSVVIHREDSFRMLFPESWTPSSGNPASQTAPAGDPEHAQLVVQTADDPAKLKAPIFPGQEVRQDPELDVYGATTFPTVYRSESGGSEFAVKLQVQKTAYLFDYRRGGDADTAFFRALMTGVILTPAV